MPVLLIGLCLLLAFAACGNTKSVAEKLAELCGADIYEITAAQPYTAEDINYNNSTCRANREMNDESARPEIGSDLIDLSGYDTVLIGYPIWWGTMPRILNTFLIPTSKVLFQSRQTFPCSHSTGNRRNAETARNRLP